MTTLFFTCLISLVVLTFVCFENPAIVVTLLIFLALLWIFPVPTIIGLIILGFRSMF